MAQFPFRIYGGNVYDVMNTTTSNTDFVKVMNLENYIKKLINKTVKNDFKTEQLGFQRSTDIENVIKNRSFCRKNMILL